MPNCIDCGSEISKEQWNNFEGMCSECIRVEGLIKSNIQDVFALRSFKKRIKERKKKWKPIS